MTTISLLLLLRVLGTQFPNINHRKHWLSTAVGLLVLNCEACEACW
uniref:Uncharacterized protein n=1 Tax=Arundo donax TaxID=35708 RepID=A0A0A9EGA4_ARUDO